MRIGALVSGGKDSLFAAYNSGKEHKLACLIAIKSRNPESYMFHIPNVDLVRLQAESMGLPLVFLETEGVKEEELKDLKRAIEIAKEKYGIEGVVSGAIASNYQKKRVDDICKGLNLASLAPLWQTNIEIYLRVLLRDFEVIITGIACEGLDESDLGRRFDMYFLEKLKKTHVNPVGEGGEFETFVVNCPLFKKMIRIEKADKKTENECTGHYVITKAVLA